MIRFIPTTIALLVLVVHLPQASGLTTITWNGGVGAWSNASRWTPFGIPDGAGFHAFLDNGNALNSMVSLDTSVTLGGLTINAGDTLAIEDGRTLALANAIVNNDGQISLNSAGSGAYMSIEGSVTLRGAGRLTLNSESYNTISYHGDPDADILINKQTIEGRGDVHVKLHNQGGWIDANVIGQLLNLNRATTNTGTLRASNGGTLSMNDINVANTGGMIQTVGNSVVNLNSSTIVGGTLSNAGGSLLSGANTRLDGAGAGITLSGSYTIGDGAATVINGIVQNNAVMALNSAGGGASLSIDGTVTLQGTGRITMNEVSYNRIAYHGLPEADRLNSYQMIEGRGDIDVNFNNAPAGLVDANFAGESLSLSRSIVNTGTLRASSGGVLSITSALVTNTTGMVEALADSLVHFNASELTGGTFRTAGTGEIRLSNSSVLGGSLSNNSTGTIRAASGTSIVAGLDNTTGGRVVIDSGATLVMRGALQNAGTVELNSGGAGANLLIDGLVNLEGWGSVTLSNDNYNGIRYHLNPDTDTLNSYQNIAGRGEIDVNLDNRLGGLINANVNGESLTLYRATTNAGTLQASNGGTLSLASIAVVNTGAVIEALAESTVDFNGSVISGGTLNNNGGYLLSGAATRLNASGAGIILNGTYTIGNGAATVINGNLTNNGSVLLTSTGGGAVLFLDGVVNLQGAGGVTLGNDFYNVISYYTDPLTDTLNNSQTIEGRGYIDINLNNLAAKLVNANVPGERLTIARTVSNSGVLQASDGGTLAISATTISNVGGIIQALANSGLSLNHGTTIAGGTVANFGGTVTFGSNVTLDGTDPAGISLQGTIGVLDRTSITLVGRVINRGVISLNSTGEGTILAVGGNETNVVTLDGSGVIRMGSLGPWDTIAATTAGGRLVNANNLIEGAGSIGDGSLKFTNRGVVDADLPGQALTINLSNAAGAAVNTGTMRASGGGTLALESAIANTDGLTNGLVESANGSLIAINGGMLTGGVMQTEGTGRIDLAGGSITGGSLLNSSAGLIRAASGLSTINGLNNAAKGQVRIENAAALVVQNTLQNAGTISLASTGGGATLYIEGAVNLLGSGNIAMTDFGFNSIRYRNAPESDTLHNHQRIEGRGAIDVPFVNHPTGIVHANLSGAVLEILRNTANSGILQASGGGRFELSAPITANIGGTIQAHADSTVAFTGNPTIQGGSIKNLGGIVALESNVTFDGTDASGITLEGPFVVPNGIHLTLINSVFNKGSVTLQSNGGGSTVMAGGNGNGVVTLRGGGTVTLGGTDTYAAITAAVSGNWLINQDNIIQGKGSIGLGAMKLTNNGLINANVSGQSLTITPHSDAGINAGTLLASGGGVLVIENTITNSGGLIEAAKDSFLEVRSGTLDGGTVQTVNTGEIRLLTAEVLNGSLLNSSQGIIRAMSGSSRINTLNNAFGGRVLIDNSATLVLEGSLTNSGDIRLNSNGEGANLFINEAVYLFGGGKITLGSSDSFNQIRYFDAPASDVLFSYQTIEGKGDIGVLLYNTAAGRVDANAPNQALNLNSSVTNAGTLQASNGGTLSLNGILVANAGATIQALPYSTVYLNNSTIIGGTIINSGVGIFSGFGTYLDGSDAGGIALQGVYTVGNGAASVLLGSVYNADRIVLNSAGSGASLFIDGAVNLHGPGCVILGTGEYNQIHYSLAAATDTLNNFQTIAGKGTINVLLYNATDSLVDANMPGQTLNLSASVNNDGTLQASNGGTLSLNGIIVANAGATIQALATSTVNLNNSTIIGGTLNNTGVGIFSGAGTYLDGSAAGGITLQGQYTINNGADTVLRGMVNNATLIVLKSTDAYSSLFIDGSVNLTGTGTVTLGSGDYNLIRYNSVSATDVLNNYQKIDGQGGIGVLLHNTSAGSVNANVPNRTLNLNSRVTNGGVLQGSNGGTLSLNGIIVANAGGTIQALANSTVNLNNSTIIGGTLNNTGVGIFSGVGTFLDGSVADGIALQGKYTIDNGAATVLRGMVNNATLIALNATDSYTSLIIDGTVNLYGAGEVILGNGDYNQIRYNLAPDSDILNNYQTIRGKGNIEVLFYNGEDHLVDADVPGQTLGMSGSVTNEGVLRASNGGILLLNGVFVANSDAIIQARLDSTVDLNSSTIVGGVLSNVGGYMLSGSGTILDGSQGDGITLLGTYTIGDGAATALRGNITNASRIAVSSTGSGATLSIDGIVHLEGPGEVTLGSGNNNRIGYYGDPGGALLNNHQLIQGRGAIDVRINNVPGALMNANASGLGLTVSRSLANFGTLRAENYGTLELSGGGLSTGVIEIDAGAQVLFTGGDFVLNQGADISGAGMAWIMGGTLIIGDTQWETVAATNLQLSSGALTGPGALVVSDAFTWDGGTISGEGSLTMPLGSTASFGGSSGTLRERAIFNHGTINWSAPTMTAGNGSVMTNTGTINLQDNPSLYREGEFTITNSGLLRKTTSNGRADFHATLVNTGTIEVQNGTLGLGGSTNNTGNLIVNNRSAAELSRLDFFGGTHDLNVGTTITGTGQVRIDGGAVNLNTTISAPHLALISGALQGVGNLDIQNSFQWSGGTLGGGGTTTIASGATMVMGTAAGKYIDGRDLVNNGTASWTDGSMTAAGGARFINNGTLGVTGDVTFNSAPDLDGFVNNGTLVVPNTGSLIINGDFSNYGTVQQGRPGASALSRGGIGATDHGDAEVTVNGKIRAKGKWTLWDHFLHWVSGYEPLEVEGELTAFGSNGGATINSPVPTTIKGSLSAIDGARISNENGGITVDAGGLAKADGTNALISVSNADIVALGGGHIVGTNAGAIIAIGGGNIVAWGGGHGVATNGGKLGTEGGGSLTARSGGTLAASNGGTLSASGGGNIVGSNAGAVIALGGGNVINGNGSAIAGYDRSGLKGTGSSFSVDSFTSTILADDGGNLIGHTGGLFTGNMVALAGGSIIPGDVGAAGTMTLHGHLDLLAASLLKIDLLGTAQGIGYDFLNVAGAVTFDGDLQLNMTYALRTLAAGKTFTVLTAQEPIVGTIGNLTDDRVFTLDGFGSFKVTYGTDTNIVLNDFQATELTYPLWTTAWDFDTLEDENFSADPDLDGVRNGMEYALGMDPLAPDGDLRPTVFIMQVTGVKYLALSYVRQAGVNRPSDVTYAVQRSTNLRAAGGGWSAAGLVQQSVTPGPDAGFETIVVRSATAVGSIGNKAEFLRLSVTTL